MKVLIIVDMQEDFVNLSLGSQQARAIVPNVVKKIKEFDGLIFATKDTHDDNYLKTLEGVNLPIPHCIVGSVGHDLICELKELKESGIDFIEIEKQSFGSTLLWNYIQNAMTDKNGTIIHELESIELVGVCTSICVISNALILKAHLHEVPIIVDSSCCACITAESHKIAIEAMKMCQIDIVGDEL